MRLSLATLALFSLAACGGAAPDEDAQAMEQEQEQEQAEAAALGRDTDETVLDDMIQTQDEARAVEGVTLGRKAELDGALEAQAQGDGGDADGD